MSQTEYRYCPMCRTELAPAVHGGKPRLACASCGFVHWRNPTPVVAGIVERDGRVVLVRSHGWPQTWYGLVTGFLESGETPDAAVVREVEEELGIAARVTAFVGAYAFDRLNQIIFAYHVDGGAGTIRLDATELADHKEVPIAQLKPWPQGTGPALADWLRSRGYTPEIAPLGTPLD
jgi:NADH pyrophosphatase NudC (nudix superfamily)